jgi:hypothetical protein
MRNFNVQSETNWRAFLGCLFGLNSVRVLSTLIVCAAGVWLFVNVEIQRDDDNPTAEPSAPVTEPATTAIADLPIMTKSGEFPAAWTNIRGLDVSPVREEAISPGQPVLKLVALATGDGHYLSMRVSSLHKDIVYAIGVWLKPDSQALAFLQVNDQKPTNYGLLFCNLADRSILKVQRDVVSQKIEPGRDGWLKVTLALRNADGYLDVTFGFVSPGYSTVFKGNGQSTLTFGGIETVLQK